MARMSTARWQQHAVNAVLVLSAGVLASVLFLGFRQDQQGDVLARVDDVTASQQQSAESTECAREINADGEVAQLETLATLQDGLLDLLDDGEVTTATETSVIRLDAVLDEAIEGYENINQRCPVPGSEHYGDPNDSND